jgi:hypothetical protein
MSKPFGIVEKDTAGKSKEISFAVALSSSHDKGES